MEREATGAYLEWLAGLYGHDKALMERIEAAAVWCKGAPAK
jgi:hypothetical protein